MNESSKWAVLKARQNFSQKYTGFSVNSNAEPEFNPKGCEVCNISANDSGGAGDTLEVICLTHKDVEARKFDNQYDFDLCSGCINSLTNDDDSDLE